MTKKVTLTLRVSEEEYTLISDVQRIVKDIGTVKFENITSIELDPTVRFTKGRAIACAMEYLKDTVLGVREQERSEAAYRLKEGRR